MKNLSLVNLVNVTVLGTSMTGFLYLSLLDASIKSLLLLVLSTIACLILVRASAATRHWVWATTMIGLLLMPAFAWLLPEWRVLPSWLSLENIMQSTTAYQPIATSPPSRTLSSPILIEPQPASSSETFSLDPVFAPLSAQPIASVPAEIVDPISIRLSANFLLGAWGTGCLFCLIPIFVAAFRLRQTELVYKKNNPLPPRVLSRVTTLANDLRIQVPRILVGPVGTMPMVWSFWKSRLFLPSDMGHWSTARQNAVLLHELVHLKRRDSAWFLVGQIARAVNWFNPLAWYAVHRLRIECERACDDHVLRMGVDASEYAGHLLELSTSVRTASGTGALALAMASSSIVEKRIVSILDEKMNRCGVTLRRAIGVLVVVSLSVAALATLAATATEDNTISDRDEEVPVKYPHCVVNVDDLESRLLADAIAAFNKEAMESPTGRLQLPITEQATLSAIAKSAELEHVSEPAKVTLREIVKTKTLPANAYFRRFTRFDDEQQMQGVWWVRLFVEEKDPPIYSVPVRAAPIFTRPYTQMERQQNAENGLTLINRFVSYFEEPPTSRLRETFPKEAVGQFLALVAKADKAKDLDAMKELFHWQGASDSTREFVSSELQTLLDATILKIKIEPRTLNGNLIHWSAFQHYEPNLPVVGFLEIEYTTLLKRFQERSGPNKTLSLELGLFGNEFRLVNYVALGERNLPKGSVDGLSMRGNTEPLADGTYLMTDLVTNPGSLISAHLANEEIRQRDFENKKTKNAQSSKANDKTDKEENSLALEKQNLELKKQLERSKKTIDYLQKRMDRLARKLDEMQGEDFQYVQGKILEVTDGGSNVYINLGKADGLLPGASFGVIDSGVTRVADAKPKTKIEVVEVIQSAEHLSRCKVSSIHTADTILKGDGIYSPAWQPGQQVEFALIGKMDIDGDGKDDRETVRRMIVQRGGIVTVDIPSTGKRTGELSINTRWIVIGDDFKAMDEKGILESKAKSLGISRIKLDKLLGWLRGSERASDGVDVDSRQKSQPR